jgi:hypothetical protein
MSARKGCEKGKVLACPKCLSLIEARVVRALSMARSLGVDPDDTLMLAGSIASDLNEAKGWLRDLCASGNSQGGCR